MGDAGSAGGRVADGCEITRAGNYNKQSSTTWISQHSGVKTAYSSTLDYESIWVCLFFNVNLSKARLSTLQSNSFLYRAADFLP